MMMKKINRTYYLGCVALTLIIGFIADHYTTSDIKIWYYDLDKPYFEPPNWLYKSAWFLSFAGMGGALYHLLTAKKGPKRTQALTAFTVMMVLAFSWSFIFFNFKELDLAALIMVFTWIAVSLLLLRSHRVSMAAVYYLIPAFLWATFGVVATWAFWQLN